MKEIFNNLTSIYHLLPPISELVLNKIDGGFSNKTYSLNRNNVPLFVVRVPDLDAESFLINREDERRILPLATEAGLSPPLMLIRRDGFMVSRFVSQRAFPWDIEHKENDVIRLAKQLKRIHQLKIEEKPYQINVVIKHYIEQIGHIPGMDILWLKQCDLLTRIMIILMAQIPVYQACVCHNDLNPQNCLADDSEFWVIDWEYTGWGDPLFDLAVVKASHNLTCSQSKSLIYTYDATLPVEKTMRILEYYHALYLIREMTWMLLKFFIANDGSEDLSFYYSVAEQLKQKLLALNVDICDEFDVFER